MCLTSLFMLVAQPQTLKRDHAQVGGAGKQHTRWTKKMKLGDSVEEVLLACYIAHALFYRTPTQVCEAARYAIQHGRLEGRLDMVFDVSRLDWCAAANISTIIVEYDGVYYHSKPENIERDVKKTQHILETHKQSLVVRVRDGGLGTLPCEKNSRLLQVCIPRNTSLMATKAQLVMRAILDQFPQCTTSTTIMAHTYTHRVKSVESMYVSMRECVCARLLREGLGNARFRL